MICSGSSTSDHLRVCLAAVTHWHMLHVFYQNRSQQIRVYRPTPANHLLLEIEFYWNSVTPLSGVLSVAAFMLQW